MAPVLLAVTLCGSWTTDLEILTSGSYRIKQDEDVYSLLLALSVVIDALRQLRGKQVCRRLAQLFSMA